MQGPREVHQLEIQEHANTQEGSHKGCVEEGVTVQSQHPRLPSK